MPLIPYPDVPAYPGVPAIPRAALSSPVLAIGITAVSSILAKAFQQPSKWGIFDSSGNQVGINPGSASVLTASVVPTLSTLTFDFTKEVRVSDFPVEMGSFASYNKVESPANPMVTLNLDGQESDRTTFLNAIDAACKSTNLYSVHTPEVTYVNYSLERYTYRRTSDRGATLLSVEVSLKEIRQVSSTLSQSTPIDNPQNPAATPSTDSGSVQATPPDQSTLKSITNALPSLMGVQ